MGWRDWREKIGTPAWVRNARALLEMRIKEHGYPPIGPADAAFGKTDVEIRAELGDPNHERTFRGFNYVHDMRAWEYWQIDCNNDDRGILAVVLFVKNGKKWQVSSVVTAEARRT